jgi:hypothetical protein
MDQKRCAYCGAADVKFEKEHVFPKCLYPPSKAHSRVQRMTVLACATCNRGWSDDEAHFRNMLLVSGDSNAAVRELWQSKALPSFDEVDGSRRTQDLRRQMWLVETNEGPRYAVYPAEDKRVTRVIRKVIRGLCHYHHVMSPVREQQVWADVLKWEVPQRLLQELIYQHREEDIVQYWYGVLDDQLIHSVWLLTFFERCTFIGAVFRAEDVSPEQWDVD